jgi:hypothetical protein
MEDAKPVSVIKFAFGALAAVLALNLLLRVFLKLEGVPVTLGISISVAGLAAWWFAKSVGRAPTQQERSRFLWLYGGSLALLFLAVVLLASLKRSPNAAGLFIFFLHYLPYPAFAQMFFSEKYFKKFSPK